MRDSRDFRRGLGRLVVAVAVAARASASASASANDRARIRASPGELIARDSIGSIHFRPAYRVLAITLPRASSRVALACVARVFASAGSGSRAQSKRSLAATGKRRECCNCSNAALHSTLEIGHSTLDIGQSAFDYRLSTVGSRESEVARVQRNLSEFNPRVCALRFAWELDSNLAPD